MILIVILYALLSATFSLGKLLLNYGHPFFLVGIRMSIAGCLLLFYQYVVDKKQFNFSSKRGFIYIQIIFFITYIPYFLRFWGMRYMPACKASLMYSLGPFLSYLLACLMKDEQIKMQKIIGLMVGLIAFIPSLWTKNLWGGTNVQQSTLPSLAIIISSISLSYGWLLVKRLMRQTNESPAALNGMSMTIGGIMALTTSYIFEPPTFIQNPQTFLTILGIIIIVSNIICHNLYAHLLKTYSQTFLTFAGFLVPLFTAGYEYMLFKTPISWEFIATYAGIMTGLIIFYRDELKERGITHQMELIGNK